MFKRERDIMMTKYKVGEEVANATMEWLNKIVWVLAKNKYGMVRDVSNDLKGKILLCVELQDDLGFKDCYVKEVTDTSHTMLAEIGFEVDGIGDYYCKKGKYKSYVIEVDKEGYLVSNTDYCGYITQPLHEALSQLMREQQ